MGSGDRERVRTSDKREWLPTLRPFAAESYIYECCVRMAQMDLHECNVRKYEWDLVQQTVNVCIDETKNPVFRQSFFFTTPTHPTLTRSILPSLLCVCVCVVQHCFQRRDEILLIGNVRDALRILNVPKYIRYFVLSFFIRSPLFAFEFNIFFTIIRQSLCVVASTSTVAWLSVACFWFLPPMCK